MGSEGAARSSAQTPEFPIGGSGGPKGVVVPCLSHALSVGSQMQHSQQVVVSSLSDLPQLVSEVVAFAWYCLYCLYCCIVLEFDFVLVIRALLFLAVIGLWHFGSEIFSCLVWLIFLPTTLSSFS